MTAEQPRLGPLFDKQKALDLKEQGIELVLDNAGDGFTEKACALIREIHCGETVLAETWRQTCLDHGVTPHHPNAWGALTSTLRKRGIIRDTGEFRIAKSVKNHGHTYRLWHVSKGHAEQQDI